LQESCNLTTHTIRHRAIKILSCKTIIDTNNLPLLIVNGIITKSKYLNKINPKDINSIDILKESIATNLYHSRGVNGVIIVNLKKGKQISDSLLKVIKQDAANEALIAKKAAEEAEAKRKEAARLEAIRIAEEKAQIAKAWYTLLPKATANTIKNLYDSTIALNDNNYVYFLKMAVALKNFGKDNEATEALSNLAEMDLENHELLRACAYVFESWNMQPEAIQMYQKVQNIKAEEPQTTRDYALALAANNQYQEAVKALEQVPFKNWGPYEARFTGIKSIIINEWNNYALTNNITTDTALNKLVIEMPIDLRIVLDWNKDATDIDLHVIDPNGEEVYYSHKTSKIGGRLSRDFTQGYGPEEFLQKKAIPGKYKVFINYFGDTQQGDKAPTTVKTTIFKNYGSAAQSKEVFVKVLSLLGQSESDNGDKKKYLAEIIF
jgi:hypothetical protein